MIVQPPSPEGPPRKPLTIRTLLILTAVFSSTAACAGYLWRSANGHPEQIGQFVFMTAMMPLLMMVAAYWTLRIAKNIRR